MSNQEDRFDFSDSENHGNQGERYRKSSEDKNDNGKADCKKFYAIKTIKSVI